MGNSYSWSNRGKIEFTDEDVKLALEALPASERIKEIATLKVSEGTNPSAIESFAKMAGQLNGRIRGEYGTLSVVVPKTTDELREQALYNLRYLTDFAEIRDQRAEESGVEPEPEKD